jgi:hypothetical protein
MSLPITPAGPDERTRDRTERPLVVVTIRPVARVVERPQWFKATRPVVIDDDPTWQDDEAAPPV